MDVTDTMWDFDDWPDVAPTEILPGLSVGGTADDYIGSPPPRRRYRARSTRMKSS